MYQRTLSQAIKSSGIGLHSGKKVHVNLLPHHTDGGIVFRRIDLAQPVDIPADALLVQDTLMSSNLVKNGVRVGTVEHLMSALAGMGVDNAIIEVSAPEVPIMDGSAAPFVYLLAQAGITSQTVAKQFIRITQPISVTDADKTATFLPYDGFKLAFEIDFNHPVFSDEHQKASMVFSTASYIDELSQARTFGFMKDIEQLHANNLALGGSMDNAIVLDDTQVLNEEGLRFADEFVRHKLLDAIGDLYLVGKPILGEFIGYKSGHALNNQLIRQLLANPNCYELVSFTDSQQCPISYVDTAMLAVA